MILPEWEDAVSRIQTSLDSMDAVRRLCLLTVACEHLLPFAEHAESHGLGVNSRVLGRPIDVLWDHVSGRSSSMASPADRLEARVPTDWAGVGLSGHGAEQVAGLVRCLAITREFEADPTSTRAVDGLVGVADALSDFGDLPQDELAEVERVGTPVAAGVWPSTDLDSLRHDARRHGQALLERVVGMGLWDE